MPSIGSTSFSSTSAGHHPKGKLGNVAREEVHVCNSPTDARLSTAYEQGVWIWPSGILAPPLTSEADARGSGYPSSPTQPHNPERQQPSRSANPRTTKPASILCTTGSKEPYSALPITPGAFIDLIQPSSPAKQASHGTDGELIGPFFSFQVIDIEV